MVKYSSPKKNEQRPPQKTSISRHLLRVFIISFTIVLIVEIIILVVIIILSRTEKMPARFGIGFGSFQVFRHLTIAYQFGNGLLVIAFLLAAFNVLLHWLRKHWRRLPK